MGHIGIDMHEMESVPTTDPLWSALVRWCGSLARHFSVVDVARRAAQHQNLP
jgi:hypothetical protein